MDLPLTRAAVLAAALTLLAPFEAPAQKDDLACKQEPGNRWFWVERAFCDEWPIVQELLRPSPAELSSFVREPSAFPEPVAR